jgi:hypothetical protein
VSTTHSRRHQHGFAWATAWSCPECFADKFPGLAKDPKRHLTEPEISTGMRVSIVCLGCARENAKAWGWDLTDFGPTVEEHNRYKMFCPHEGEMSAATRAVVTACKTCFAEEFPDEVGDPCSVFDALCTVTSLGHAEALEKLGGWFLFREERQVSALECPHLTDETWDPFPEGRTVFYEGDDPAGFVAEMLSLGIDVYATPPDLGTGPTWSYFDKPELWPGYDEENGWRFFVPAGRVDEICGSDKWSIGT